ncbi:MAG: hypothetical protein Q9167_002205 [Letrouitia subvulpina]
MPSERRNLRSNKDTSSSTNGEKARSNSQSSSSKDKPVPTRTTSTKAKTSSSKKGSSNNAAKDGGTSKSRPNGAEPVENGVNGTNDVDMADEGLEPTRSTPVKDAEDEMTVVVPPPKGSKISSNFSEDPDGDVAMDASENSDPSARETEVIDPKVKAASDIKSNFVLLERAVTQFDARFTLRVLRSISSIRKQLSPDLLIQIITETYISTNPVTQTFLAVLGREDAPFPEGLSEMDVDSFVKEKSHSSSKHSITSKEVLPEVDFYLSILIQIYLYDTKAIELGAKFSSNLIARLRNLNRRTLDALAARVYFYYSLFFEQLTPLPPSPSASVVSIRQNLLQALRTSVLRKDQDIQATVTTLLLRNYLSTSHISQADLLISHTDFPPAASNNQIARYLYYLGRIRAIQLAYTEAHDHLISATRKSPSTPSSGGFYQASSKLLVVVELLMGDIPDRAIFRQPSIEHAMKPYLSLVQAVRVGKIDGFLNVVQTHNAVFRRDGTYTLILRLRQNVIKTGIRMMSLSYAKISLRDICMKLDLESEESAEYIVAKSIRDGVIEATLDHEHGFMKSKEGGDVYATREPGEAFHDRIRACLNLHDESVKAMRFPMNQHRLELKNAQEARERERELAKEIVEGEMDDDDAGGDFEGMIDVPVRLRRAIVLHDLVLVKRIVKNNPSSIQNPDLGENGNTSLHLAAQLGATEIAEFLIDAGHEDAGISRNGNWDTPLHLAVETSIPVAVLLATRFPRCIPWRNKQGADAVWRDLSSPPPPGHLLPSFPARNVDLKGSDATQLMLSSRSSPPTAIGPTSLTSTPPQTAAAAAVAATAPPGTQPAAPQQNQQNPEKLLMALLTLSPVPPATLLQAADLDGNTALHYASAYGHLKAIRTLMAAGANPMARNKSNWTAVSYSSTVQAEVYFKGLVMSQQQQLAEGQARRDGEGGRRGGAAGLRLVRTGGEEVKDERGLVGRNRAGSAE